MSEISFRSIGDNPTVEAMLLQELCMSDGIDDAIISEFPETIDLYTNQPYEKSVERIVDRYTGHDPIALGSIAMRGGRAIGLSYSGIAEFQGVNDIVPKLGINVSSWLSANYRNQGIGSEMVQHETTRAMENTLNYDSRKWHNKRIWTSIKMGNIASKRIYEKAGFVLVDAMHDDPNRDLYMQSRS